MSDNQAGDTAPAVLPSDKETPATSRRARGRPAGSKSGVRTDRKPDTPQQRIDQLKAELEKAQKALREHQARRDSIVGRAVVAHALANADYRRQLAALLRKEITSKGDLAAIEELLHVTMTSPDQKCQACGAPIPVLNPLRQP